MKAAAAGAAATAVAGAVALIATVVGVAVPLAARQACQPTGIGTPTGTPVAGDPGSVDNPLGFAVALLTTLGDPLTQANVGTLVGWEQIEGGNWHNAATFNPLNTTLRQPGSTSMNSVGVQAYGSWQQGLQATADTLANGYQDILAAFAAGVGLTRPLAGLNRWSGGGYSTVPAVNVGTTVADLNTANHTPQPVPGIVPGTGQPADLGPIIADAENYLGVPYLWGGTTPDGLDCSGLVQRVYADLGITLPRTTWEQYAATIPVPPGQERPGDLVFFDSISDGPLGHVGLNIGGGRMIDAPYTGTVVRVDNIMTPNRGFRRPAAATTITAGAPGTCAAPGGSPAPNGGTGTTIADLTADMTQPHEAALEGVPASYSWASRPELDAGDRPPADMHAATAWAQCYTQAGTPPDGRVELRNQALWIWSNSRRRWERVQYAAAPQVLHYADDFAGNQSTGTDATPADGAVAVSMVGGWNLHLWPQARVSIDPADVGGVWTTVQARLVGNLAARVLCNSGGDWWQGLDSPYPTNSQMFEGRFRVLTGTWLTVNATSWTAQQFAADPPPLGG